MPKYSTLDSRDSCSVYLDDYDRKESLGRPSYGICDWISWAIIFFLWIISLPVTWCCSFKIIPQYERAIVFRLGRLLPLKGPGLIYIIPCVDVWKKVDMRMRAFKVAPQEIITIDRGLIKVGADVQYRISDPLLANTMMKDIDQSLRSSGHAALNSHLCSEKLVYIQNEKLYLQTRLQNHMNKIVSEWGIEIARFELTQSVVLKGPGGSNPNEDNQEGGGAAIMNLIKGFTQQSSSFSMPPGMFGNQTPMMTQSLPNQPPSNEQVGKLLTPDELFCIVKGIIDEEMCQQVQAIYEFQVTDKNQVDKIWCIDLRNSPGCVVNGSSTKHIPDVKFETSEENFQKLFYGQISPTNAYMNGSLIINGSIQTAMKLEVLVKKLKGN